MAKTAQEAEEKQEQAEQGDSKTQAQAAEFSEAAATGISGAGTSIDILLDMNVPVTIAVGHVDMSIQRLLQLGPGSVLRLDKPIEAPADLYLKDVKFATGTIVVVDDKFAVRIKEVIGAGGFASQNTQ